MTHNDPRSSFPCREDGENLQTFASNIESGLKASLPSHDHPYDRVSVLAFHWANDIMGVDGQEAELLGVFRDIYGFGTESWTIPVVGDPEYHLATKLIYWTRTHEGDRTLRMYIYSGHASYRGTDSNKWYFRQADTHGNLCGPQVEWHATRSPEIVEKSKGGMGETETLAGIFAILLQRAYQSQVSAYPVHIPKMNSPSVVPQPLIQKTAKHKRVKTQHRVLLSFHLKDNEPNLQAWNNWLASNLPPGILTADVKIESVFKIKSTSIVMLVTVPLEIWTMLNMDDEAISFVSHVFSHNDLPALERRLLPHLAGRPCCQASENTSPSHPSQESLT
ncbi:hypothetical protein BDW59DRAFT_173710 [Aspergillus cavernicola]|uniref:Uncharacterized protein n=1 Tax=Aspergillus cavernicola TaxID=176166 RepID=A0ABR4I4T6_9EURO